MASSSSSSTPHPQNTFNKTKTNTPLPPSVFDPNSSPNTTFVQADPSNFKAVVQKLTGATAQAGKPISPDMGPRKPAFKLNERRQTARKLEIKLNNGGADGSVPGSAMQRGFFGIVGEMIMVSPVSPLEILGRGSPRTPRSPLEEEERAIAEKGFFLHPIPSPLSTHGGSEPPQLLPLFPLHSPRDDSASPPPP